MSQSAGLIQTLNLVLSFSLFFLVRRKELIVLARIFCIILSKYLPDVLGSRYKVGTMLVVFILNFAILMVHSFCDWKLVSNYRPLASSHTFNCAMKGSGSENE